MFCTECGTRAEGGKFCANCGTKLTQPEAPDKVDNPCIAEVALSSGGNCSVTESSSSWFEICSPFEGEVVTSLEYYNALERHYVETGDMTQEEAAEQAVENERRYQEGCMNDIFAVIPTVGMVKAPFDCTVGEDSSLDGFVLCAGNGVAVKIRFEYDENVYDSMETYVNKGDRIKQGELLYTFDVTKLPSDVPAAVEIETFCFGDVSFDHRPTFTIVDRSTVSFGDTIFDVKGEQPASRERVAAMIAGYHAQMTILNRESAAAEADFEQALAEFDETIGQAEEFPSFEEMNVLAERIIQSLSLTDEYTALLKASQEFDPTDTSDGHLIILEAMVGNLNRQKQELSGQENSYVDKQFNAVKELIRLIYEKRELEGRAAIDERLRNEFWDEVGNPSDAENLVRFGRKIGRAAINLAFKVAKEMINENTTGGK